MVSEYESTLLEAWQRKQDAIPVLLADNLRKEREIAALREQLAPTASDEYTEQDRHNEGCCWTWQRDQCKGAGCLCVCHASSDQHTQRTAEEIDEIRGRHVKNGDPADPHCDHCSDASYPIWPCDTAVLLAVVDSQRTIMDAQTRVSERHRKRVQELARQVAALREALALARGLLDTATPLPEPGSFAAGVIQQLDAALATAGGEGQRAGDNDHD